MLIIKTMENDKERKEEKCRIERKGKLQVLVDISRRHRQSMRVERKIRKL